MWSDQIDIVSEYDGTCSSCHWSRTKTHECARCEDTRHLLTAPPSLLYRILSWEYSPFLYAQKTIFNALSTRIIRIAWECVKWSDNKIYSNGVTTNMGKHVNYPNRSNQFYFVCLQSQSLNSNHSTSNGHGRLCQSIKYTRNGRTRHAIWKYVIFATEKNEMISFNVSNDADR